MNLYVIGVNYKTAPVQIREKFSIHQEEHERVLSSLRLLDGVSECSLLSTCNRTEIHIFSEDALLSTGHIEAYLCALKDIDIYAAKKYFYVYEGMGAVKHIMKVASGMDSMILGEDQILGQFRNAYEISMKEGTSKAVLNTLSRLAITASKKIKTRNLMLGKATSIAGQVGTLLTELFGKELAEKYILIIGSGEIGKMVSEELLHRGAAGIYMTKRSRDGGEENTTDASKVKLVGYNDRYSYIEECDIIVGATASPHYTVTRDMLEKRIANKDQRFIFIDLAVPRDFDETISQLQKVSLYNIDDLRNLAWENGKHSHQIDLPYIQEQIRCYTDEFIRWFQYRNTFTHCKEA